MIDVFPPRFVARLRAILDDKDLALVEESIARPRSTSFRVNTIKATHDVVLARLSALGVVVSPAPSPLDDASVLVDERARDVLVRSALVDEGLIYVQTLSSMVPPRLLAPRPGDEVLDLAAAPGGKAIALAGLMENRGRLAVVEPSRDRFFRLKANLERAGVSIASLYMKDGAIVGAKVAERFDAVLLDAPCSTEARMTSDDRAALDDWSEKKIARMARVQSRLIESGLRALKPGGRLVYSTCSFAPEENEGVVAGLLARFPSSVRVMPIALGFEHARDGLASFEGQPFPEALRGTKRILPTGAFEASYVALLEKTAPLDDGMPQGQGRGPRRVSRRRR